jgi:hypothetical protein
MSDQKEAAGGVSAKERAAERFKITIVGPAELLRKVRP